MSKLKFTVLVDELLNEYDCKLIGMEFNEEGISKITYTDGIFERVLHVAYRFMNRARLKLDILDQLDLLIPVDPEWDLGF